MKRILVINPNSNAAVTNGLQHCLAPLQIKGQIEIECMTLAEGPFGIETMLDAESVVLPLRRVVLEREDADAYVIACYSDPGLALCREATPKPVFGIQESGLFSALQRGARVGVVALGTKSIARHLPYIRALGLESRLAAERPLHLSVAQSEEAAAFPRIEEVARLLVEEDLADTILLGCAGMAGHVKRLEDALGVPVTEPTQAATVQALGAVLLN
ncbi:Asp/Glu/hydantoin racemase [Litoreibacter ponti]|uniref:Asp/Glu/hydantoin racemase n=1 Tax=Litoreibacter ponti TaxID=1510457 RepID=A0A2T6BHB3_9RHOB|nr:aspartate/glutamate racemase family protein [Litoreibacter ponti]PTX55450.1 Asp/Glu/hydantoin racemase [Litoreibacter ponti]